MSWAEMHSFINTVAPQHLGRYECNINISIYEIIDENIECNRFFSINFMYSQAKGGQSYNNKRGRANRGLPENCGLAEGFYDGSYWTDNVGPLGEPGTYFLSAFFGITAPSDANNTNILWYSRTRKNIYNQPKVGSSCAVAAQRYVWDITTSQYVSVSDGTTRYFQIGAPRVLYSTDYNTTRELKNMTSLAGGKYLQNKIRAVLVYPLTYTSGLEDYRAFLVKPYGVDYVGFGINPTTTDFEIIAENSFSKNRNKMRVPVTGTFNEPNGFYMSPVFDFAKHKNGTSLDSNGLPVKIEFYIRNTVTGGRSSIIKQKLKVLRRANNVSYTFVPHT